MGCSSLGEDPATSTSTGEESSSLAEAWRHDAKNGKHDCVEHAKFDLGFWGKKDDGMKSFWDFMKDEKDDHRKGKKLFLGRFDAKKHDFKRDGKKDEKRFFDRFEDAKDDFEHDGKTSKQVFSESFDEAKDDFLDRKDAKKHFDFDENDVDRRIVWGHSDNDGSDMMFFWGDKKDDGNDGKDDDGDD